MVIDFLIALDYIIVYMQPKKSLLKRLIKIDVILMVIIAGGLIAVRLSRQPEPAYHPSIAAIEAYFKQGESLNAYEEALQYSQEHPNDSTAYKYLGEALFQVERYAESTENFELALKDKSLTTSTKAEIFYLIGRNYDFLTDSDTAVSYFQEAIKIDPNYSPAYNSLGMIALRKKNYDEAFSFFEKELFLIPDSENNPLSSHSYYYLAQVYFETDNYPKAQQMIEVAQKLAPQLRELNLNLLLNNIESLRLKIEEKLIN